MTDQLALDMLGDPADDVLKTADISPDGVYRYALNRIWGRGHGILPWIMLNPSTADHAIDDPTIRRCMTFARDWGYTGITVANLYAFRATNPAELLTAADPVGPRNDARLREVLERAAADGLPVVAAWGANAKPDRVERLRAMPHADRLFALAVTKDGQPRHPLYMPKTATLTSWPLPGEEGASNTVEHEFGLRAVTGSGNLIVTCSCGWESKPVHLINTELMRERHRTEVAAK